MSYTLAYTGAEIDALLGKIDAIFVAEYGSTIYSEVTAAIAAGNKVIVANAGKVYVYAGQDDNSGYVFTQSGPNAAKPNATYVTLSTGNVWSTATVDLATVQQFYASLMEDTASGSIASFPDGAENVPVKELTADIEPIQDLHGQASPWPPAGGKQIFPLTESYLKSKNTGGTWSGDTYSLHGVTYTLVKDNAGNIVGININGTATDITRFFLLLPVEINSLLAADTNYTLSGKPNMTCHLQYTNNVDNAKEDMGSGVTFQKYADTYTQQQMLLRLDAGYGGTNVMFKPMLCLASATDPTVFAPYSNICPISGYTGAEIPVTGINLCEDVIYGYPDTSILSIVGGSYTSAVFYGKAGSVVSFSASNANRNALAFVGDSKPSVGSSFQYLVPQATYYTLPETGYYVLYLCNAITDNVQVNLGSTSLPYEPYNGTTYSVSWTDEAGTVYKGYLVVNSDGSKKLVVPYVGADLGDFTYTRSTSYAHPFFVADITAKPSAKCISSEYKFYSTPSSGSDFGNNAPNGVLCVSSGGSGLFIRNDAYTDAAAFKTAMSGQTLVYELATPVEYDLADTQQIKTLLGDNNIWSNTGDISVKYRCNTALYILKKTGA